MTNKNFQVNLQGMIDLLSNHLYASPDVFIRELLQNGVDAITARKRLGHQFQEQVTVELFGTNTISVVDNGIGLTEQEIEQFLSQIGHTSKREDPDSADDYIGQFGVGLLSCFVVSDEIVLITKSALDGYGLEWRGRPDGTYTIRQVQRDIPIGTSLFLTCKEGFEEYFDQDRLYQLLQHYGVFLPVPVVLMEGKQQWRINEAELPWKMDKQAALDYAESNLHHRFLDVIPLHSTIGEVEGVAFILPYAVSLQAERKHSVYVKRMLLSDSMDKMMPEWAFFVTCMLNANGLRPTASREAFYENELYFAVRDELGDCIKRYFVGLAEHDPDLLQRIISIHNASIKAMAVEDDELYNLFIDKLTFETSFGTMAMSEIVKHGDSLIVSTTLDEFRQVARIAEAQRLMVINGGYVHDLELVRKLRHHRDHLEVTILDVLHFANRLQPLPKEDDQRTAAFKALAEQTLAPFQCEAVIRKFEPQDVPVLYNTTDEINFFRMAESGKNGLNELFTEVVQIVTDELYDIPYARLCFNYNNPIVDRMVGCANESIQRLCVEMLYTQALLLGHHPLGAEELQLMNRSFTALLQLGLDHAAGNGGAS